ncbi:hypothetical protein N836_32755 [Leptolyngbya sp. Heron Island J]|uniref:hypothetical protein n=1 Tax=Leptolyngbya sp. Heron Island J TaxID=1385935 RepID=UPI0003B94BC3|nr:hypothetical protein [Leptolyngbya sp. Heron Island J]ESA38200.1 hypothetical protein N836_32755 [Leptolyngbya sp. Heron Island J]
MANSVVTNLIPEPTGPNGEAGEPTYLSFLNRTDEIAVQNVVGLDLASAAFEYATV